MGSVLLPLVFAGTSLLTSLLVFKNLHKPAINRNDFLTKHTALIDIKNSNVSLKIALEYHTVPLIREIYSFTKFSSCLIEPNQTWIKYVESYSLEPANWTLTPNPDTPLYVIPLCTSNVKRPDQPIRMNITITNNTPDEIHITPENLVNKLQPTGSYPRTIEVNLPSINQSVDSSPTTCESGMKGEIPSENLCATYEQQKQNTIQGHRHKVLQTTILRVASGKFCEKSNWKC